MQQPGLDCERDEYPPVGFWQDQDIHGQWVRMVPKIENGAAGAALFNLGFCRFDAEGNPPAATRNAAFDRVVHGPDRDTEVHTGEVTTTLSTVSIRFDAYPHQPDFGLTANPCWPKRLVDDPGFALLVSDRWYFEPNNAQRAQTANALYKDPPPLALTQNNPPRPGYQKRFVDLLDMDNQYDERNITREVKEEYLAQIGMHKCDSTECIDKLEEMHASPLHIIMPTMSTGPRAREAEPTAADTDLATKATSKAPMVGGGAQSILNSIPKPTERAP